ncbi:MAG: bacteriorhodopsin-like [Bacteroidota bacterium]
MDSLNLLSLLSVVQLKSGDVIGFTFFTGYMAMFAASVFFFFERQNVDGKWKTSLLISGLITMIAAVHYYYMRGYYLETGESPIEFRYIDWTLTVPLMCVEFYLLIKPYGAKQSIMWRLILASVVMLVCGYIGEAIQPESTILWGVLSTVGYVYIVYEATAGSVKKLADESNDPDVAKAVRLLRNFVVVGWAIYPIGYMAMEGNLLSSVLAPESLDLFYNIGDAINKIGFGLVVYSVAVNSKGSATAAA